jgi:NAD(P)-dependent dehydrogenase (short-subunit alcohol dehydrogenase family)
MARRALVTGSAQGIGRAVADALSGLGLEVVGVDVLEQAEGPCARTVRADLADPSDCRRVLGEAGPVDVLVNIVNVSSIGARDGRLSHGTVYAATKAGVIAVTRSFAARYGRSGVTVNAVAPGGVETEMTASIPAETRAGYLADIPAGRFCPPEEVAAVVAFLAGDGASFVNGATLDVNGGWYMG